MRARRRAPLRFGLNVAGLRHFELARHPHLPATVADAKLEEPLQPLAGQRPELAEVVQPAELIVFVTREPADLGGLVQRCPFALPDAPHTRGIGRGSLLLYGMPESDIKARIHALTVRHPVEMAEEADLDGQDVPDIVGPDLAVLFCGINPGRMSGALGQHFARPGNRFWKVLCAAGFTDRVLIPSEQRLLLGYRLGVTNLVDRTTAAAAEVGAAELAEGASRLAGKVERWRPAWVAVLGVVAYRRAFGRPRASIGPQEERIGSAGIWLLPNPSGLQARYQLPEMVEMFTELRIAAGMTAPLRTSASGE